MNSYLAQHRRLFLAQLPIAAISVGILIWRVDILEGFRGLSGVQPGWIVLGLVTFTFSKMIHAYRWRLLLQHRDVPLPPLLGIFLVSNLANALVPFRAGDLIRIELPSRLLKLPRAELASNVLVVESIFDGLAFALLAITAAIFIGDPLFALPVTIIVLTLISIGFAGLSTIARLQIPEDPQQSALLRRLPSRWHEPAARLARQFIMGMTSLRHRRSIAGAILVSVVAWMGEVIVYWMLGQAFGFHLSLGEAIVLMIAANLIVSIPITPWDFGPYEIAVTEAFVLLGGDRVEASIYAVGSHLLLLAWITVSGGIAMLALSLRPSEVLRAVEPGQSEQHSEH
jgi:uncharacterized protein (TIRG00374 family)